MLLSPHSSSPLGTINLFFVSMCFCLVLFIQRVIEMPYAYQCCAFGVCENVYKISNQWNKGDNGSAEDLHKKDAGIFQVQGKISYVTDKTVSERGLRSHQTDHLNSRQTSI